MQPKPAVGDALAALPFAQRAVVVLHTSRGCPYAEVAEVTPQHRPGGP